MFLSPDPAASTSFSGTYTYATANPLRYIDITGLFSWDEVLGGVQNVSGIVSDVAGVVAIVALATGVGAPIAAIAGGISIAAGAVHAGTKAIQAYDTCNSGKGSCGDAVAEALMSTVAIVPGGRLIKGAASGVKALSNASKGADEAGALVRYDPKFASRNLLGQAGDGYARTPGGRTLSVHAAERILYGGPGRPPTTMERVDDILDKPTSVKWNPANRTVQVNQGKAYVAVRDSGPQQHIVTVMVP